MMRLLNKKRNRWLLAGLIAGLFSLYYGLGLALWRSPQVEYYNLGMQAYTQGDMQTAAKAFDRSFAAYRGSQDRTWLQRFVYPKPDPELAALAQFEKGKALIRLQQLPQAVDALKTSLKLNPGDGYAGMSVEDANRMHEEALNVKYDLELLFKNNPNLAQQEGKGKGNGQQQGNKPVPGTDPGSQPGKGNKDDI